MRSVALRLPAKQHFLCVQEWHFLLCDGDKTQGLLLSFFEGWHTSKQNELERNPSLPTGLWQWHSKSDMAAGILDLASRKTIIGAVAGLADRGYIETKLAPDPRNPKQDITHVRLICKAIQNAIDHHYPTVDPPMCKTTPPLCNITQPPQSNDTAPRVKLPSPLCKITPLNIRNSSLLPSSQTQHSISAGEGDAAAIFSKLLEIGDIDQTWAHQIANKTTLEYASAMVSRCQTEHHTPGWLRTAVEAGNYALVKITPREQRERPTDAIRTFNSYDKVTQADLLHRLSVRWKDNASAAAKIKHTMAGDTPITSKMATECVAMKNGGN